MSTGRLPGFNGESYTEATLPTAAVAARTLPLGYRVMCTDSGVERALLAVGGAPYWYVAGAAPTSVGVAGAVVSYAGGTNVAPAGREVFGAGATLLSPTVTEHWGDTTAGVAAVQLPTAAAVGSIHIVMDVKGQFGANKVTVTDQGGLTINGQPSQDLATTWRSWRFEKVADAGNGWVMSP